MEKNVDSPQPPLHFPSLPASTLLHKGWGTAEMRMHVLKK